MEGKLLTAGERGKMGQVDKGDNDDDFISMLLSGRPTPPRDLDILDW
jgi:hypothetical protein